MQRHEHFEELSSLAVIGELDGTELAEFTAHLRECAICQSTYVEFAHLSNEHLPLATRRPLRANVSPTDSFRNGALQRAAAEGLRISPEAMRGPVGVRKRVRRWLEDLNWGIRARATQLGLSVALLSVIAISAIALRLDLSRKHEIEKLRTDLSHTQSDLSRSQRDAAQLHSSVDSAAHANSRAIADTELLAQRLADAGAQVTRLEVAHQQDLSAIGALEARIGQLTGDNAALSQHASSNDGQVATLRSQLEQARSTAAEREAQLVASQYQITDLTNRLKGQEAALERERELLTAGRDIRDLMGARNLHIIDVHDMDSRGESRPFGRIFLTEGKRLVFYAYDLDSTKTRNVAFQAWGQRDAGGRNAVNLGILYVDDQKQSRWALKVEDPNLLQALDSVFVTVEPNGGVQRPTGKKLMYAYLRNPINHP
jgi:hypothetical protein